MANQNESPIDAFANLSNFSQTTTNSPSENDLYQQATLLQQLLSNPNLQAPEQLQRQTAHQTQYQVGPYLQQQILQSQQSYEPQEQQGQIYGPQEQQGQVLDSAALQFTDQQQQPQHEIPEHQPEQDHNTMSFRAGLPTNAFETLVAPPAHFMQAELQPQRRADLFTQSTLTEREQFAIFVKILMKLTGNNPAIKMRAKAIISECTRRNRIGDLDYTPLMAAVERNLKNGVGELYWARAKLFFDAYCERTGIRSSIGTTQVSVASI